MRNEIIEVTHLFLGSFAFSVCVCVCRQCMLASYQINISVRLISCICILHIPQSFVLHFLYFLSFSNATRVIEIHLDKIIQMAFYEMISLEAFLYFVQLSDFCLNKTDYLYSIIYLIKSMPNVLKNTFKLSSSLFISLHEVEFLVVCIQRHVQKDYRLGKQTSLF